MIGPVSSRFSDSLKNACLAISAFCLLSACDNSSNTQSTIPEVTEKPGITTAQLAELANWVSLDHLAETVSTSPVLATLKRRETLIDLLDRVGAQRQDSNSLVYEAANHIDMRRLRPGQKVSVYFDAADQSKLTALSMHPDNERQVLVTRNSGGNWVSRELKVKLQADHKKVGGAITTSIYDLALKQGAKDQQVVDFANIFAYDVDFQREIREGDTFEITYEVMRDEKGQAIKGGNVLYAAIDGQKVKRNFYRFTTSDDGITDYYDETGKAARKFLMKTPINGARLSSRFGKRRHPVLGYTKMHKGTDFAAPRGTPIYAAGNGVIERASRYGSFGNYIRIRHADGYKTAYAHLNGYAKGIKKGARVTQGQTIGYVGTTGRSTGPHLHYEVTIKGLHVDAMRLKLPTGRKLEGEMLNAFKAEKARIDAIRQQQNLPVQYAHAETKPPA